MNVHQLIAFQFWDGAYNVEATPEPEPVAAVPRFGGGPFWRKYGYDSAYDDIREQELDVEEEEQVADEIRAKLAKKRQTKADEAVNSAAGAILRNEPIDLVAVQQKAYDRIVKAQAGLRAEFKDALATRKAFKAELRRKLQYAEQQRKIEERRLAAEAKIRAEQAKIEAKKRAEQDELDMLYLMFMDFDED